jgi:glyoxylase I family protein
MSTHAAASESIAAQIGITGVHHVAIIVESLERSMEFYGDMLGLEINPERPEDKLPYRGAWLWIGPEMIHLMELPNPDCAHVEFRPTHGGRDRHFCIGVKNLKPLTDCLDARGVAYTASKSGRPAIFFRDPDANTLEVVEGLQWR